MGRKKKLVLNTITGILYQVVTVVCGFILPRFFLKYYGSEVNGLVSSITHFLGFISLCECGVGAVVQSALYKPLADNDEDGISQIIISAERFFKKVAYILLVYVVALIIFYPMAVSKSFDYIYTGSLILVISISSFAQYYFSITYRLLLGADQKGYIQLITQAATLVTNTAVCVVLMTAGAGIHVVKLTTSLIFLIQPICFSAYVKKNYRLNKKLTLTEEPIKQKWNGLSQHIALVIMSNADTVILTVFSTLKDVSIYNVYYLVVYGMKSVILSATNGVQALFGNMYAKKETENLNKAFSYFEWVSHTLVVWLYSSAGMIILPFVRVYTRGINDANYVVPLFAVLITLAQSSNCLRIPYNIMVLAAGHYKQTQASALIETVINIVTSVVLVFKFGLVGVAIGTFVAIMYRTVYLAWYLQENIINRSLKYFFQHMVVDAITACASVAATFWIPNNCTDYFGFLILAVEIAAIIFTVCVIVNLAFYRTMVVTLVKKVLQRLHTIKKGCMKR